MNIQKITVSILAIVCLMAEASHASAFRSAFRKVMPTAVGASGLLIGSKKVVEETNNSKEFYIESTLPEKAKNRIEEIYAQHGKKGVRILEQNPNSSIIEDTTNTAPFRLPNNIVVLPEPACIALTRGRTNRTYLTPEEVEASLHITAALSSSFEDWGMFSQLPAALIGRKLGQLKSKTGGRIGLVAGFLGAQLIVSLIPAYPLTKNFNLLDSKTASNAASCYRKAGYYGLSNSLEKIAEELRAQGK